jgi:hypothetical protein
MAGRRAANVTQRDLSTTGPETLDHWDFESVQNIFDGVIKASAYTTSSRSGNLEADRSADVKANEIFLLLTTMPLAPASIAL